MQVVYLWGAQSCTSSAHTAQELLVQFGQVNIDSKAYREAAAARVGLSIPSQVPLQSQDYAAKYDLASKLTKLKGVQGLKAQLYGLDAVMAGKGGSQAPAATEDASFDNLLK